MGEHVDIEEFDTCDKEESDLDSDKSRIVSKVDDDKVRCKHCGNWITSEEYEEYVGDDED